MKLSARLSAVAVVAGASVLVIASPAVAAPWANSQITGGASWEFNSSEAGFGHIYDESFSLSSVTHAFGSLYVNDNGAECDESTADVQVEASTGDIVVTCDADEVIPGVFVTPNYRLYSAGDLGRMFYTIENRTGAVITADSFYLYDNYDSRGRYLTNTGGTTGVLSGAADTWVLVSDTDGSTVAGSAWALVGNTATTSSADIENDDSSYHDFVDLTFEANSAIYVADFVSIHLPLAPYDTAAQDVAFAAATAAASEFSSFSGRLVAGLPAGITVLNWGAIPGGAEPALADTGANGTAIAATGIGALVLAVGGVGLVLSRRRRATI